ETTPPPTITTATTQPTLYANSVSPDEHASRLNGPDSRNVRIRRTVALLSTTNAQVSSPRNTTSLV
ncbi:hypothetical protein, partial [Streptomyces sp. NPDC005336]|uniref:hypothetical protein n=1 Tax=Streptomyces sp. NPDC005336 TaxID=3157035 RepID=UPI00339FD516